MGHNKKVSEKVKKTRKLLFLSNLYVPSFPWSASVSFSYFSKIRISSSHSPAEELSLASCCLQVPGAWGPNFHLVLFRTDMPFSSNLLSLHAHYLESILYVTAPSLKTEIKLHWFGESRHVSACPHLRAEAMYYVTSCPKLGRGSTYSQLLSVCSEEL